MTECCWVIYQSLLLITAIFLSSKSLLIPVKSASCKGSVCPAEKFFSHASKIKHAAHMQICFNMSKSASLKSPLMSELEYIIIHHGTVSMGFAMRLVGNGMTA